MAEKSVAPKTIELDPMFFIPEGLGEVESKTDSVSERTVAVEVWDDLTEPPNEVRESSDILFSPDILDIESQTIRATATGHQVVDVAFIVEDVPGAVRYELRITKL